MRAPDDFGEGLELFFQVDRAYSRLAFPNPSSNFADAPRAPGNLLPEPLVERAQLRCALLRLPFQVRLMLTMLQQLPPAFQRPLYPRR